jgi:hypothetical protein
MFDRTVILLRNDGGILEMKAAYPVPARITLDAESIEKLSGHDATPAAWRDRPAVKAKESDFVFWSWKRFLGVNDTAAIYLESDEVRL